MARKPDVPCASCGSLMWGGSSSLPPGEATCRPCRAAASCGSTRGYSRGCRCEGCTSAKRDEMRDYYAARRGAGNPVRKPRADSRPCKSCGEDFAPRRDALASGQGRYCSISCAVAARNESRGFVPGGKRGRARKSEFRRRAERLATKAARGSSGGGRVWVQGDCLVCGTAFLSPGAASRYCSRLCRAKNRNVLFGLSWLDRMALFERDHWSCHLCGLRVDLRRSPKDPLYPTLDHLIPRSSGGSDAVGNLMTAHALCNSIRRDLPVEVMRSASAVADLRARLAAREVNLVSH